MRLLIAPGRHPLVANALESLLAYPDFRALWLSTLFAWSAWWGQNVVLIWLAFDITRSELAVSAAAAAGLTPMLLGPVGGLLADRLHRPRLLIGAQSLGLATGVVIALLVTLDRAEYWHVVIATALLGLTTQPLMPTRFTLTIDLVGERRVSSANAVTTAGMLGSRMVVPAAAGALIATFGAHVALWFCLAWYLPASWPLLRIEDARREPRSAMTAALGEIAHGFRYAVTSPALRALLLVTVLANILGWPVILGFLPVFAEEVFEVGAAGLGLIVGVHGLGALTAAIAIASWGDFRWKGMLYLIATVLFGLGLAAFALSGGFALALLLIFFAGLGGSGFGVMQSTVTMLLSPPEARGRLLGVLMISIGVLPGATLVQGAAASSLGVVTTTAASGLLLAALTLAITAVSPELRRAR